MLRSTAALAAILAAHPAFLLQTQAQIIIDDFGDVPSPPGYQVLTVILPGNSAEVTRAGNKDHIIGGTRTVGILSPSGPDESRIRAIIDPSSYPNFTYNQDLHTESVCLLQYDGGNGSSLDPTGLGGISLGRLDSSYFRFNISGDGGSTSLTLRLYTDADHASAAVVSWGAGAVVEPVEVELAFAAFAPIGSAGGGDRAADHRGCGFGFWAGQPGGGAGAIVVDGAGGLWDAGVGGWAAGVARALGRGHRLSDAAHRTAAAKELIGWRRCA